MLLSTPRMVNMLEGRGAEGGAEWYGVCSGSSGTCVVCAFQDDDVVVEKGGGGAQELELEQERFGADTHNVHPVGDLKRHRQGSSRARETIAPIFKERGKMRAIYSQYCLLLFKEK